MVLYGRDAYDGAGGALVVVQALNNKLMTNPDIARDGVYAAGRSGTGLANADFKKLMFTVLTPVLFASVAAGKSIT